MQRIITNFTVLDDDSRGDTMGWRNFISTRGDHKVELRLGGNTVAEAQLEDFKKLMLAGEQLIELMAKQEKADEKASK